MLESLAAGVETEAVTGAVAGAVLGLSVGDAVYYTYCISALLFLFFLIASVHKPMWHLYSVQSVLQLVYFAALDGDLGRWLGLAEHRDWLVLGSGVLLTAVAFRVQSHLIGAEHELSRYKGPLALLSWVSLSMLVLASLFPLAVVNSVIVGLVITALLSMLLPPLTWGFLPRDAQRVAMPFIVCVGLLAGIALIVLGVFFQLSDDAARWLRHGIMLWSVTAGVVTMLYMTFHIERTRQRAAERALRAAHGERELQRALYESEVEYNRVQQLATVRGEALENVAHDLRQPLFSLRASLDVLLRDQTPSVRNQVRDALEYADRLAESYLDAKRDGQEQVAENNSVDALRQKSEPVALSVYLKALQRMFAQQAGDRGVDLAVQPSSLIVHAPPVDVMRILSNLVNNALLHADADRLVIGARRKQDGAVLEVHDNGVGMDATALAQMRDRGSRGDHSQGSGLGLAIVAQLCERCGFDWQPHSISGRGSVMRVRLPAAQLAAR